MKKLFKNHWKELAIVCVYVIVASLAYGVWFHSLWHKWYIDLITCVVILAIGVVIGYFYITGMDKEKANKESKIEDTNSVLENENTKGE